MYDSNAAPAHECGAEYRDEFFGLSSKLPSEFDTIVSSHFFEHMQNPVPFMKHLGEEMKDGNKLIFSIPNLKFWLKAGNTNSLFFEHTFFLTDEYMEYLLAVSGFKILSKKEFLHHSIFYATEKSKDSGLPVLPKRLYEENKKIFFEYIEYYKTFAQRVNALLSEHSYREVFLFGAHIFSQFILGFGVDENKIVAILDNDKEKQGKRLQGCKLYCRSPRILSDMNNPLVILRAGAYQEEIKADILKINPKTQIIE